MAWFEESGGKTVLKVWLQPRAAKAVIAGIHGDALKIKVTSPPIEGKANDQLIALLSGWLDIPASQIIIRSGRASRRKVLEIEGLTIKEIKDRLRVD